MRYFVQSASETTLHNPKLRDNYQCYSYSYVELRSWADVGIIAVVELAPTSAEQHVRGRVCAGQQPVGCHPAALPPCSAFGPPLGI